MNNILVNNSIPFNKNIAKFFNNKDVALILAALINKYNYYLKYEYIKENDWFSSTVEDLEHDTLCSKYKQSQAIKELVKAELISYKIENNPLRTRFFCFTNKNIDNIEKIIDSKIKNSSDKCLNNLTISEDYSAQQDEMTKELVKRFNDLSFDEKLDVFSYIKNIK